MLRFWGLFICVCVFLSSCPSIAFATKDYQKRNEKYLRDVKKRDAKREYYRNRENDSPSGKMTVDAYNAISKHKNSDGELKKIDKPIQPMPSEMKYAPKPTYKIVKYNEPVGSVELSLNKNFYRTKQQNAQGIVSPDLTKLVYPAIYYSPDSASTSAELFLIPLDTSKTKIERIKYAHTSNRTEKPLLSTSKKIDNFATFRTLTPVDFSADGRKLLIKEKIGNTNDGIWQTNMWIYDFTTEKAVELSEVRDAITYHWTEFRGLPLADKRWDIVPLGFSATEPDRVVCRAYAYTGSVPVFLGIWDIDTNRSRSNLISTENIPVNISQNGFKLAEDDVEPYFLVMQEEKALQKLDKKKLKAQKKNKKEYYKECKTAYKAQLKEIQTEYKENIKEYNRLTKYSGSTSYNEAVELYRADKIKELEKSIQKEEKMINKLNSQIETLDKKLEEFENSEPIDN